MSRFKPKYVSECRSGRAAARRACHRVGIPRHLCAHLERFEGRGAGIRVTRTCAHKSRLLRPIGAVKARGKHYCPDRETRSIRARRSTRERSSTEKGFCSSSKPCWLSPVRTWL